MFACLYLPLYIQDFSLFYRHEGSAWPGEEGDLDLIGGVEGLGTSCPVFVLSQARSGDGETAAVVFRWAEAALRVLHRARVNVEPAASNNDSKGALFSGAITLVFRNLF